MRPATALHIAFENEEVCEASEWASPNLVVSLLSNTVTFRRLNKSEGTALARGRGCSWPDHGARACVCESRTLSQLCDASMPGRGLVQGIYEEQRLPEVAAQDAQRAAKAAALSSACGLRLRGALACRRRHPRPWKPSPGTTHTSTVFNRRPLRSPWHNLAWP
jgi:hypothetical protein